MKKRLKRESSLHDFVREKKTTCSLHDLQTERERQEETDIV